MKNLFILGILLIGLSSCSSIRVSNDFDSKVDLTVYKTYAFYKSGIDQLKMSDLDKKRVLRAIDRELQAKGYTKSTQPDFMINIFTKSKEVIDVYSTNYFGYGYYGWNPYMWGPNNTNVDQYTEGTLFIDFIDVKKKEMYWQGIGTAAITRATGEKKEKLIDGYVAKILAQYPDAQQ
jgi:hypothetical protein